MIHGAKINNILYTSRGFSRNYKREIPIMKKSRALLLATPYSMKVFNRNITQP
jgi:hypothetical protein